MESCRRVQSVESAERGLSASSTWAALILEIGAATQNRDSAVVDTSMPEAWSARTTIAMSVPATP